MKYPIEDEDVLRSNLGASVYGTLRESLATGRFKPDARLRIRELAEQLGTSVTPARDAILQLASEGALVLRSPRDIRVLSVERYLEIRVIRVELEGLAAAADARAVSPAALAELENLVDLNKKAIEDGDLVTALLYNPRFHLGLAKAAGMPTLEELIDQLWVRVAPLIAASYEAFSDRSRVGYHESVLQALRDRDSDCPPHDSVKISWKVARPCLPVSRASRPSTIERRPADELPQSVD
ncbi:MAG: Transcriptional regulator, GntR family [uncultured Caballeronia sp.]|nr:MAG: Transcriptional regulator, GntR family [uncultured Caballeronia sp.]